MQFQSTPHIGSGKTPSVPQMLDTRTHAAVQAMVLKAIAAYPDEQARIERGAQLALQGHVELLEDGSAKVRSSDLAQTYYCINRTCPCWDFQRAPGGRCKHRWAKTLLRRATDALYRAPVATADPQQPYDFPSYTTFAATYVGPEQAYQGCNGQAHVIRDGFIFTPDEAPFFAFPCAYAEIALGPGLA